MIADLIFSHMFAPNIVAVGWSIGCVLLGYGVCQRDEAKKRKREEEARRSRGPWA